MPDGGIEGLIPQRAPGIHPGDRRRAMADLIYLVVGIAVLLIFAGYALLLRRA
ncbi:MAG TPA: hypothetical protein VIJ94_11445 [Caulobacteraceae bacterium]